MIKKDVEQVDAQEKKGEEIKPVRKKRLQYKVDQWSVVVSVKEVD